MVARATDAPVTGTTTPDGNLSNRAKLFAATGLDASRVSNLWLTYDRPHYRNFHRATDGRHLLRPTDGVLTTRRGLGLLLTPADCLAAVLIDPERRALMLVHLGRHGLEDRAGIAAVDFMRQHGTQPQRIRAWFSPSAGAGKYPLWTFNHRGIQEVALEQLTVAGVPASHIITSDIDTTTHPNYFSHSSGDHHQRFAVLAKLN
jgi:copper oxidase (laccase) domain-containing protein